MANNKKSSNKDVKKLNEYIESLEKRIDRKVDSKSGEPRIGPGTSQVPTSQVSQPLIEP